MKILLLFAFLLSTIKINAQVEIDSLMNLSFDELLKISVNTSSKTEQELWETSSNLIIISSETIKSKGYSDLTDLLRNLPYFQIQSEYGHWTKGGIVTFRGLRSGDSGNNKVLILLNGNQIMDEGGEGIFLGLNSIPIKAIERIEILLGPNSTIYGKFAYAAVINLIYKTKDYTFADLSYGSFNTRQINLGLSKNLDEDTKILLNFYSYKSDEQDPTEKSISYLNRHFFPKHPYTEVFYRGSNNLISKIGISHKNLKLNYHRFDLETSETFGGNPDFYVMEYSTQLAQINQGLSLNYDLNINNHLNLQLGYEYKQNEFEPKTANLYIADLNNPFIIKNDSLIINPLYAYGGRKYYYFRTKAHSFNLKSEFDFSENIKNISGIELDLVKGIPIISEGKGGKPFTTDVQKNKLEHSSNHTGIFSEFLMKLDDDLRISAGGRFIFIDDSKNFFTPRLAIIKKLEQNIFKLIFSKGYLVPSISQKYFESITTFSWIQKSPYLETENNTSLEFDWVYTFHNSQFNFNAFYNWIENGIVESLPTGDSSYVSIDNKNYYVPILKSQNLSSEKRWGLAMSYALNINNFNFDINYSYIDGFKKQHTFQKNIYDNLVSNHTINANISYKSDLISVNLNTNWRSKNRILSAHRFTLYKTLVDNNGYLNFDSVWLWNLHFRLNNIINKLDIYLNIKNLFDKEYYGQTISANWGDPKILQDMRRIDLGFQINY